MSTDIRQLREEISRLKEELRNLRTEVSTVNSVLSLSLRLNRRLTGNENIQQAISGMQDAISVANQLQVAYMSLQTLRMAAGDPFAWLGAGAAVAGVGISMYDVVNR